MKSEITDIPADVMTPTLSKRVWWDGERIARADGPMVPTLDVNMVDAVFAEPAISFLDESEKTTRNIESLTRQLREMEAQCSKLRDLLEVSKKR